MPVFAVVAPTVPLMLMDAVPVRFVTTPADGVPRSPPLTSAVPLASGSVKVRFAVSVVGVMVAAKLPVPPARPCNCTAS